MKKNIICLMMFVLAGSLFAENAVDYTRKWESRNTLIYENGNELWDIYINEYPSTKGTIYNVEYCIEKKEYSEKKSSFKGWFIYDTYDLFFDSYKKAYEFMDTLTQKYLIDKTILKTERFLDFVENNFHYQFERNRYYDYESKDKKYRIKLVSTENYSAAINVYKSFYGTNEDTEYAFVYRDYEKNIDYWIDDFDADLFFLQFTSFYDNDESELTLHDYFSTLSGELVEAEGTSGTMTVDDFDMSSLYTAFKNDFWYSTFASIVEFLEDDDESNNPVSYMPVIF